MRPRSASFGSGWPEDTIDPLVKLHRAVTGLDLDGRRVSNDKLNVEDAVPRYLASRLEPGALADLAVLSENILKIPPERIAECKVEMTVFGGHIVYEAASFDQGDHQRSRKRNNSKARKRAPGGTH